MKKSYDIFDNLPLQGEAVELADGVPRAWRLLKTGTNNLSQSGRDAAIILSPEDVQGIADYHAKKGEKIPIDSRHALYALAEEAQTTEGEVLKMFPHKTAAVGFGDLEARPDGIWITNVELNPIGQKAMLNGLFKYFSPVIRGLRDGPKRITSVALDNVPALNNLDQIAATAENDNQTGDQSMTKLEQALAALLNSDSVALEAEGAADNVAEKVKEKTAEIKELGELVKEIKEVLGVAGDALPAEIRGKLQAVVDAAAKTESLAAKVEEQALAAETERGLAEGKLTRAMLAKAPFNTFDSVAMAAYLDAVPAVVPLQRAATPAAPQRETAALSAEESKIYKMMGLTEEEAKKAKEYNNDATKC